MLGMEGRAVVIRVGLIDYAAPWEGRRREGRRREGEVE